MRVVWHGGRIQCQVREMQRTARGMATQESRRTQSGDAMKSILDRTFQYAPAKSHEGSAEEFAKRQRERLERARATAAEAKAKTRTLKREAK